MTRPLERRGPDGTNLWIGENIALGHTLLATTPESLAEQLPLTDAASGCTITADVRLDNRHDLIAALGLSGETRPIGDGELILLAYLRWGEDCPKQLLGDFAFAIWDPRHQQLFCARDHMGMRQLVYHYAPARIFVFATETGAVLAHPAVPRRVNEARIADFLDNLEGVDLVSTLFDGVCRLPPAHSLTVADGGLELRRYWELQLPPELHLPSDEAYAEAFREVFTEAVRCRLRSAGRVGATLSGGIDSNAVVAVAASLLAEEGRDPLMTFSGIGPDAETCLETRAILAAAAAPGLEPSLVDHSKLGDLLAEVGNLTLASAEPFDAHMTLLRTVYFDARRAGMKIMLDGVGGDVVLTSGNPVAERLRSWRLRQAMAELGRRPRSWIEWRWRTRELLAALWVTFAPKGLYRLRRRLRWKVKDRQALNGKAALSADFARRIDLPARRNRLRSQPAGALPFGREYRRAAIIHPHLVVGRERYDRIASAMGIEPRDPYLDLRLIRFCLSLPESQFQQGGVPKAILRRSMAGLCPPEVISRRTKEHLGWAFTQAFLPYLSAAGRVEEDRLAAYVSPAVMARARPGSTNDMDRQRWFDLCVLSEWLYRELPRVPVASEGE